MRVIRNAKPVAFVAGGTVVAAGCLGWWHAAVVWNAQENDRAAILTAMISTIALIWGVVTLTWGLRSKPVVLMRAQLGDALLGVLPVTIFAAPLFVAPAVVSFASPSFWVACILVASVVISKNPEGKAPPLEIPPLRSVGFLDWLRWQNFGVATLFVTIFFSLLYFSGSLRHDLLTPLIALLAVLQAAVSIWRLVEQRQFFKAGAQLSGMQIIWLRAVKIHNGHEAAVQALRAMYPKIGSGHADYVIENLYQIEEKPHS